MSLKNYSLIIYLIIFIINNLTYSTPNNSDNSLESDYYSLNEDCSSSNSSLNELKNKKVGRGGGGKRKLDDFIQNNSKKMHYQKYVKKYIDEIYEIQNYFFPNENFKKEYKKYLNPKSQKEIMEYFVKKNSKMGKALIKYKKNPNKNIDNIEEPIFQGFCVLFLFGGIRADNIARHFKLQFVKVSTILHKRKVNLKQR
uniref:Uncharacterized protein n=2 Tax=Meloidogyne TaxID=189290 RepID=A0A6V7V4C2_MELEN|nr:unnamed protein product [Meloidogyne enterolobii]